MSEVIRYKPKLDERSIFVDDGVVQPPHTHMDDAERAGLATMIQNYGCAVIGGCAGFRKDRMIVSHTIGMTDRGLPEFAISGVPQTWAAALLNQFVARIPQGDTIPPEEDAILAEDFSNGYPVMARPLPTKEANQTIAFKARLYYGRDVPIWQVILSDKESRWPWEDGLADTFVMGQCPLVDWRLVGPPKE